MLSSAGSFCRPTTVDAPTTFPSASSLTSTSLTLWNYARHLELPRRESEELRHSIQVVKLNSPFELKGFTEPRLVMTDPFRQIPLMSVLLLKKSSNVPDKEFFGTKCWASHREVLCMRQK